MSPLSTKFDRLVDDLVLEDRVTGTTIAFTYDGDLTVKARGATGSGTQGVLLMVQLGIDGSDLHHAYLDFGVPEAGDPVKYDQDDRVRALSDAIEKLAVIRDHLRAAEQLEAEQAFVGASRMTVARDLSQPTTVSNETVAPASPTVGNPTVEPACNFPAPVGLRLDCPDWCVGVHNGEALEIEGPEVKVVVNHEGPKWGVFSCFADQDLATGQMTPEVVVDEVPGAVLRDGEILAYAANAAAALAWAQSVRAVA